MREPVGWSIRSRVCVHVYLCTQTHTYKDNTFERFSKRLIKQMAEHETFPFARFDGNCFCFFGGDDLLVWDLVTIPLASKTNRGPTGLLSARGVDDVYLVIAV